MGNLLSYGISSDGRTIVRFGFGVETSGKQDATILQSAIRQENDGNVDLIFWRSDPNASRALLVQFQFVFRDGSLAYAWKKDILKNPGSVFVGKLATIKIRSLIEPTIHPETKLVR